MVARLGEESFLEAVRIGADCRVGAAGDRIAENQRTGFTQLDWAGDFGLGTRAYQTAAEGHPGVGNRIEEDPFAFAVKAALGPIDFVSNFDPAPVTGFRGGFQWIRIDPKGLVGVGGKVHRQRRSTEDLDRRTGSIENSIATDHNAGIAELENRTCVDHQGNASWDFEAIAVGEG